jgi:hypothetical protein
MRGRAISTVKKETENMNKQKLKELVKTSLMKEVSNSEIELSVKNMISNSEYDMDDFKISSNNLNKIELRYQYYSRLPEDLRSSLENEFDVVENELEDEDTLPQYSYIISSKMNEGKKEDITGPKGKPDGKIDSKDYLAKRDAAIKKAKGVELDEALSSEQKMVETFLKRIAKEFDYSIQDAARFVKDTISKMNLKESSVNEDLDHKVKYSKSNDTYQVWLGNEIVTDFATKERAEKEAKRLNNLQDAKRVDKAQMKEDLDLGHEDNEPHMIKGELYRIGKYAMELYQIVDGFEGPGEVDFPAWWQSKITTSMNNMVSAKHYLDFELKEPAIDAMVGVASDEELINRVKGQMKEKGLNEKKLTSADKVQKVAETIAKKLKENVGLKKGDTVEYEGNKYKIGSFDTEANLVYLNTMGGKPAEDRKGDYLKVNATRVKKTK